MIDKLYTVEEVASLASVTPRTIRNYLKSGKLAGRKIGGQWRFSESEVQGLLSGDDAAKDAEAQEEVFDPAHDDSYSDGSEIYREPFSIVAANQDHKIIAFDPESSYASEIYEAKIPNDYPQNNAPSADQPARLPYTMPFQGRQAGAFADGANVAPQHHNPAFPHLSNPSLQNLYETAPTQYPNQAMSPFAGQVPGNPQINHYAGMVPASLFPAGQQPLSAMYYSSPIPFTPGMIAPYPPYAVPSYPHLGYLGAAPPPTTTKPTNEDTMANFSPPPSPSPKKEEKPVGNEDEKEFPFELSDIGYQVALFASEVHDCSSGPQVCTMVDLHQSLASAKITSERLMEIADQESELAANCHCYVEFDTRYYIARYTLFGTSEFLFRCMKLLG